MNEEKTLQEYKTDLSILLNNLIVEAERLGGLRVVVETLVDIIQQCNTRLEVLHENALKNLDAQRHLVEFIAHVRNIKSPNLSPGPTFPDVDKLANQIRTRFPNTH